MASETFEPDLTAAHVAMCPLRTEFTLTAWVMLASFPVIAIHPPHRFGVALAVFFLIAAGLFAWVQTWATGGRRNRLAPEPWPEHGYVEPAAHIRRAAAKKFVLVVIVWAAATLLSGNGAPLVPIAIGSAAGFAINARRVAQVERAANVVLYGQRQSWRARSNSSGRVAAYARTAGTAAD